MNVWAVGLIEGRGDAVGPAVGLALMTVVELLVEVDVSGPQTKLADVVAASVVVVVGVGTCNATGHLNVRWGGRPKVTYWGGDYSSEGTDDQ